MTLEHLNGYRNLCTHTHTHAYTHTHTHTLTLFCPDLISDEPDTGTPLSVCSVRPIETHSHTHTHTYTHTHLLYTHVCTFCTKTRRACRVAAALPQAPCTWFTKAAMSRTVELTGFEMIATQACGQCLAMPSASVATMPALMLKRSSRVIPGLRGTPVGAARDAR